MVSNIYRGPTLCQSQAKGLYVDYRVIPTQLSKVERVAGTIINCNCADEVTCHGESQDRILVYLTPELMLLGTC